MTLSMPYFVSHVLCSLDEKKAQTVVDEIKAAGGEALAVGGDVGADDFPAKIIDATIKCVSIRWETKCPY